MGTTAVREIDKVAWICLRARRVLSARTRGRSAFYIPGGKREPGESDEQTLTREIAEELGVRIVPGTIRRFGVFTAPAHAHERGIAVRMTCMFADGLGEPRPLAEIEEIAWLTSADRAISSEVDGLVFDALVGAGLLD